jgi:hypothetical protein
MTPRQAPLRCGTLAGCPRCSDRSRICAARRDILPRERVLPREFHWPDRRRSERRGTIERVPSIRFWNRKPERFALALRSTSRLHFRRDKVERISASSLVRFRWPLLLSVAGRAGGALFGLMGAVAGLSLPEIKSGRIHGAIRPGLAGRECGQHPQHELWAKVGDGVKG